MQLQAIEKHASELALPLMLAASQRAQVVVRAEYQKDFSAAETLALDVIHRAPSDPNVLFLLQECLGRQYLYAKRYDDAVSMLRKALAHNSSEYEVTRLHAQLSLSEALSQTAPDEALAAAQQGVAFARDSRRLPNTELVKALAEAAIAAYRNDGAATAFPYLDEATALLLEARQDTNSWRDLVVLLAHTLGYVHSMAATGKPPPGEASDGGEFAEPAPGIFLRYHSQRHQLFSEERVHSLRICAALFADSVDNDERLAKWLALARSPGSKAPPPDLAAPLVLFEVVELLVAGSCDLAANRTRETHPPEVGALHFILGATIALARIAIRDSQAAATKATSLSNEMLTLAVDTGCPELWTRAGGIIREGFDPTADVQDVAKLSGSNDVLQTAVLLALSATRDLPPNVAATAHARAAFRFLQQERVFMHMHRRLLVPLICEYWQAFANRSAFHFRTPAQTRDAIEKATLAPIRVRAQHVLREVFWGLGLNCDEQTNAWFHNQPT